MAKAQALRLKAPRSVLPSHRLPRNFPKLIFLSPSPIFDQPVSPGRCKSGFRQVEILRWNSLCKAWRIIKGVFSFTEPPRITLPLGVAGSSEDLGWASLHNSFTAFRRHVALGLWLMVIRHLQWISNEFDSFGEKTCNCVITKVRYCPPCSAEGTEFKVKASSAFGVIGRVGPEFSTNFLKPKKEKKLLFWVCCCFLSSWSRSVVTSLNTYFRRNGNTSCLSWRGTKSGRCLYWCPFPYTRKIDVLFRSFFLIFEQTDFPLSPLLMVHMVLLQPMGKRVGQRPCSCFAAPKDLPQRSYLEEKEGLARKTTWAGLIMCNTNCCKGENRNVTGAEFPCQGREEWHLAGSLCQPKNFW